MKDTQVLEGEPALFGDMHVFEFTASARFVDSEPLYNLGALEDGIKKIC